MPIHEQVSIHTPWDDSEVRVDESIAQLISALWADGMRTKYSCEGFLTHDPSGYIAFHHRRHAVRFARRTRAVAEVSVDPQAS
ncbi:Uncharacterised protein [Mycobacteroides abscessus subsp. abscessus]|nr:Uncharacterised protein [Mycobacteroides abscessus subsp. abscessus]SII85284.1 Uncharacterised protein [Mycobacteroides abscessus subsp. abscessus]SIL59516.1 Uncharacterised protein [Mycobacteroides abscessus subsp. abscessus]SKU54076.1 Uncharacterised protein [Mycobacteroides abscessus subsp. bolletii]